MNIQVNSLTKIFNLATPFETFALQDVSFSIGQGEIVGIIGTSGSGKSCLLRCLAGVITPTKGSIRLIPADHKIGLVIQEAEVQFFLATVFDEVALALSGQGLSSEVIQAKVKAILSLVGFKGNWDNSPFRASGGEKKRIALASILIMDPDVLLLDEPTAGLDFMGLQVISEIIMKYRLKRQTLIIISHDLDFLLREVDRFLILDQGKLVADFQTKNMQNHSSLLDDLGLGIPEEIGLLKRVLPNYIQDCLKRVNHK